MEDEGKQEEKFDFTREGEVLGYISLDQARVLAMRTARETPGDYGRGFRNANMAFEVVEDTETEDHYVVTLSFRPAGGFTGTPGREQFFIEKEGTVAIRQVLSAPSRRQRLPLLPAAIGLVAAGGIAAVVAVLALGGSGAGSAADDPEATLAPAPTAALEVIPATEPASATPTLVPATATPAPPLLPTETVAPLSTSTPRPVARPTVTMTPVMAEWFYPVSADTPLKWMPLDRDVMIALETGSVDRVVGLRFHLLPEIPQLPAGYTSSGIQFDLLVHPDHDSDPIPYIFLKPLTLTINLRASDATAAGGLESNLVIQRYHDGEQGWEPLATMVDFGASTATAEVDRLSIFALTIREQEPTATSTPTPTAKTIPMATPTLVPMVTPVPTMKPSPTLIPLPTPTPTPTPTVVPSGGLIRGATISGRVTDAETGLPLADIDVAAGPEGVPELSHLYRVRTDANGSYTLTGIREGIIKIHSDETQGYINEMDRTVTVGVSESVTGFDYSLRRGAIISGRVTDVDTGLPIAGLLIRAEEYRGEREFNVDTGQDGRYRLDGLTPGVYIVVAQAEGKGYITQLYDNTHVWDDAARFAVTGAEVVEGIDFGLKRGATISGRVIDAETGLPIANMDVTITFTDRDGIYRGRTDIDGRSTMGAIPDGVIEVVVSGQGYLQTSKTVTVRDGQDVMDFDF